MFIVSPLITSFRGIIKAENLEKRLLSAFH